METCLQLDQILLPLLLMGTFYITEATVVQDMFKKMDPGKTITGKVGGELKATSLEECAIR